VKIFSDSTLSHGAEPVVVAGRFRRNALPRPAGEREPLPAGLRDRLPPEWRSLMEAHAALHRRATHGALAPLTRDWVEIGPGYVGGPCFGHWDIMHATLDALTNEPALAKDQIRNQIERQLPSGAIPGVLAWNEDGTARPLGGLAPSCWPMVLDDWMDRHGVDTDLMAAGLSALRKLLDYMERERATPEGAFFFADARDREWESGVDEGVRFDLDLVGAAPVFPCVDATALGALHYRLAAKWARRLGEPCENLEKRALRLESFLLEHCRDPETGWFYDAPMVANPERRVLTFEGIWGLFACGRENPSADQAIDECLLNERHLLGAHGLLSVARSEPRFEARMWRGPSWNSMTYWAARACVRCERPDAARRLLRRALDGAAAVFDRTGAIWEFYGPDGGDPRNLQRKPGSELDHPCPDYLGHNPLIAMAELLLDLESGGPGF